MKRFALILSLAVAAVAFAHDEKQHHAAMKAAGDDMAVIKKALAEKDVKGLAAKAKQHEEEFAHVEHFWEARKSEDGVKFSKDARAAYKALAAAAEANDVEGTQKAFGMLATSCRNCHTAHREKTAEGYKIK